MPDQIALISTTPWDSYLIRNKIWTYPPRVILGPRLFLIPAEEVFFFVIQTYNTCLLYLLANKAAFHPAFLLATSHQKAGSRSQLYKFAGAACIAVSVAYGWMLVLQSGAGTYLGLILVWAGPFLFLLWILAYQLIIGLPWTCTILPIALPTLYLWAVDTLALQRGTWVIESGTKFELQLWKGLEIEEAIFFLLTNCLIVFGMLAFDNAIAVLDINCKLFSNVNGLPSPLKLIHALLITPEDYDSTRIDDLRGAITILQRKSRSFYFASAVFEGRLRIDLVFLYSFCRVADDLVDNAETGGSARLWIQKLEEFLKAAYRGDPLVPQISEFPEKARPALRQLPVHLISQQPLLDLLKGFKTDLRFSSEKDEFPIASEMDLHLYSERVAGTVAQLLIELVLANSSEVFSVEKRKELVEAGGRMGIALQCVNIARDIAIDAKMGRVYIPSTWLAEYTLSPQNVLDNPHRNEVEALRTRMLDEADSFYINSKPTISQLPREHRGGVYVAVESYMEIGRLLRTGAGKDNDRPRVSTSRRLTVAWRTLNAA